MASFMALPPELHLLISSYLTYPDALALKHTSRHFYGLVYTGVHLKVDWLVERFERKLECPMEQCSFRTDEAFCNWRIRRIMARRRRHLECPARVRGGCLVVQGQTCRSSSGDGSCFLLRLLLLRPNKRGRHAVDVLACGAHEGLCRCCCVVVSTVADAEQCSSSGCSSSALVLPGAC